MYTFREKEEYCKIFTYFIPCEIRPNTLISSIDESISPGWARAPFHLMLVFMASEVLNNVNLENGLI